MTTKTSDVRLAGHTLGTPDQTPAEAISLFARAGLDAAEIIWQDGYRGAIPETDNVAVLDEVHNASAEYGIPVIGLTPYMTGINSLDEAERTTDVQRFTRCIADAAKLGAEIVRVYAGAYTPDQASQRDQAWEQLTRSLRELAPIAADHGVVLAVENHFNTMTVTARETRDLVDAVDSASVGILYDQANLTFTHSEAHEEAQAIQSGRIAHVHAKDLVFVDSDRPFSASAVANVLGDQRAVRSRVVGEGEMDWAGIVSGLVAGNYEGVISLEYEYRWHPQDLPIPLQGFSRGAAALREYLSQGSSARNTSRRSL